MICRFCGYDIEADDLFHPTICDGQQGALDAAAHEALYGQQGDVGYETGSDTSAAAAGSIRHADLARLEAIVYALLRAQPRTCDALEATTGLAHQTASARIRGLVLRELVVDSGQRAVTRSGRRAVVWCVRGGTAS